MSDLEKERERVNEYEGPRMEMEVGVLELSPTAPLEVELDCKRGIVPPEDSRNRNCLDWRLWQYFREKYLLGICGGYISHCRI